MTGSNRVVPYSTTFRFDVDSDDKAAVRFFFNGIHSSLHQVNAIRRHLEDAVKKFRGVHVLDTPLEQLISENAEKKPHYIHVWIWCMLPVDLILAPDEESVVGGSTHSFNFEKLEVPPEYLSMSRTIFPYDVAQLHLENLDEEQLTRLKHRMLQYNPYIHFRREHFSRRPDLPFTITASDPVR